MNTLKKASGLVIGAFAANMLAADFAAAESSAWMSPGVAKRSLGSWRQQLIAKKEFPKSTGISCQVKNGAVQIKVNFSRGSQPYDDQLIYNYNKKSPDVLKVFKGYASNWSSQGYTQAGSTCSINEDGIEGYFALFRKPTVK